jgi:hypothetical protein
MQALNLYGCSKGECKSRGKFSDDVAKEAVEGLDKHDGRPNPSTLAFIPAQPQAHSRAVYSGPRVHIPAETRLRFMLRQPIYLP